MQMISIHKRLRAVVYAKLLKWERRKEMRISLNWALTWHTANLGKFKYHVCCNRQECFIWEEGVGQIIT